MIIYLFVVNQDLLRIVIINLPIEKKKKNGKNSKISIK